MKKIIKETDSKEKQKEFVKFAKAAQQKEEEYQRLLNTMRCCILLSAVLLR